MLKKIFACTLLALISTPASFAQTTVNAPKTECGWYGTIEFDPLNSTFKKGEGSSWAVRWSGVKRVYPYLGLGGAISLSESWKFKEVPSLTITARAHVEDYDKAVSPFATLDLGYGHGFEQSTNSFVFNPTVGIRYGQVGIGVGYYGTVNRSLSSAMNIRLAYFFGYNAEKTSHFFKSLDFGVAAGGFFPCNTWTESGGISLEASALYHINDYVQAGLALNFDGSLGETGAADLLFGVRGRYNFRQVHMPLGLHPFARMDLGVASVFGDETTSSFYWQPGVGISLPLKNNTKSLDLSVSYAKLLEYDGGYDHSDDKEYLKIIRVAIGYNF